MSGNGRNNQNIDFSKPVVIYGAGSGGRRTAKILADLDYLIEAFVDSNEQLWNTEQIGIVIRKPEWLEDIDCNIIIASVGESAISQYLAEQGMADRIVLKEAYILNYAESHMNELTEYQIRKPEYNRGRNVIFSSETGFGRWGVEQYTRTEAKMFKKHGIPVSIFIQEESTPETEELKDNLVKFPYMTGSYWDIIKAEVDYITDRLPCSIQDNWQSFTLIGAILTKRLFPEDVHILSVVHNDLPRFRKTVVFLEEEIDCIGAVSKDIISKLIKEDSVDKSKIVYKESPIELDTSLMKIYAMQKNVPLRLAYGARIEKRQKRTHLLLRLIDYLDKKGVSYHLDIAGTGFYRNEFLEALQEMNVSDHVSYIGFLANEDMRSFWQKHDVFISVSEYEGASLSMLEAMGNGCVPVLTKISGVKEYVEDSHNGFILELDDIEGMAEKIALLAEERDMLKMLGGRSQQCISEKCNKESYYKYFSKILKVGS